MAGYNGSAGNGAGWRCGGGATGADGGTEGGVYGPCLYLLHPPLLQAEVRNELGEGWVGDEAEVRRGVAEVLVEPGGERAEEEVIIDLRANIAELVSESLKAATIVVDGGVVLVAPKKLLLQKTRRWSWLSVKSPFSLVHTAQTSAPSVTTVWKRSGVMVRKNQRMIVVSMVDQSWNSGTRLESTVPSTWSMR